MLIGWFPILTIPVFASYVRAKSEEAEEAVSQSPEMTVSLSPLYEQSIPTCDNPAELDNLPEGHDFSPENTWENAATDVQSSEDFPGWKQRHHWREKRQAELSDDVNYLLDHVDPKRAKPSFSSWGGKRTASNFHSWGGKRSEDDNGSDDWSIPLEEIKRNNPFVYLKFANALSTTNGGFKRRPAFNSWGGKRSPSGPAFNSWGGKRAPSGPAFNSWGGKRGPAFNSWGGKRDAPGPAFNSWGGKRGTQFNSLDEKRRAQFNSWGGKRDGSGASFNSWGGKRDPAFNSWGGKRDPAFNSWGGKRDPAFNSWGGKRDPAFNSWGGKRDSAFNSWGGKRDPAFNSWGGKRDPAFNSWGGKRDPAFNSWGGKRDPAFNSWGGKRDDPGPAFNSWGGKRGPAFYSWGGKRSTDLVNNELVHENIDDINTLSEVDAKSGRVFENYSSAEPIFLQKRNAKDENVNLKQNESKVGDRHNLNKRETNEEVSKERVENAPSELERLLPSLQDSAELRELVENINEREKKCSELKSGLSRERIRYLLNFILKLSEREPEETKKSIVHRMLMRATNPGYHTTGSSFTQARRGAEFHSWGGKRSGLSNLRRYA